MEPHPSRSWHLQDDLQPAPASCSPAVIPESTLGWVGGCTCVSGRGGVGVSRQRCVSGSPRRRHQRRQPRRLRRRSAPPRAPAGRRAPPHGRARPAACTLPPPPAPHPGRGSCPVSSAASSISRIVRFTASASSGSPRDGAGRLVNLLPHRGLQRPLLGRSSQLAHSSSTHSRWPVLASGP